MKLGNYFCVKILIRNITQVKKTMDIKMGFQKIVIINKKMVRHKKLVASRLIKARLTHMKDREGHLCSVHKNMEEWVRNDRFGRFQS